MGDTVKPRLLRGLRDLLPEQAAARQWLIDTIRGVYETYGFAPLDTPAIEYLDVLYGSAGAEVQESIFTVTNPDQGRDPGDDALGLRFDLTVPLARVVSQYRDLPRPFRRYQVSQVWRADKPDPGRFREFTQFDLDSVGVPSPVADLEIITAMSDTLSALNVGAYKVRFSSRKILNLLLKYAEIPEKLEVTVRVKSGPASYTDKRVERPGTDVFRVLDKLDKAGMEKVRLELTTGYTDESGDMIPGLGLAEGQVEKIERFLSIAADKRAETLEQLYETFASVEGAEEEINLLARMSEQLGSLGYGDDKVVLDLSVARGLAYYTGPVFEAVLVDAPQFGSIFAGGRYDDLVARFLGETIPATGASIGVDRLLAALVDLGRVRSRRSTARALVTTLDQALMDEYLKMTYELRRAGIPTELYLGAERRIGKQFKHANQCGTPVVIVCGTDEMTKGEVSIKDMRLGDELSKEVGADRKKWLEEQQAQFSVERAKLVESVRGVLARYSD